MDNYTFTYNTSHSYEDNFRRWYELNKDERFKYNQREYTEEEAKKVFDSQYRGRYWLKSFFVS